MNYKKLGGGIKMRGFMCHPKVSIAVCLSCDSRKFVVPVAQRRMSMEEHAKLINKCSSRLWDVVVMRVSLHCQGCAGKVKKHLSKLEDNDTAIGVNVLGAIHSCCQILQAIFKTKDISPCKHRSGPSYFIIM
ncbi:hypothetical protein FXO38_15945 [Capsicum annuum]|nr:hypothetical protein FXO38_15945 [Capsicum annuum]